MGIHPIRDSPAFEVFVRNMLLLCLLVQAEWWLAHLLTQRAVLREISSSVLFLFVAGWSMGHGVMSELRSCQDHMA